MTQASQNKAKLFSVRCLFYDFVKLTAALPGLIWFRPKTIYAGEKAHAKIRGGALLISNHTGFTDPIALQLCVWYRRHRFICIKEFFEGKISRLFFKGFLCVPIDRENFSMESYRKIMELLEQGQLVSMFPEGHVNENSNEIAAFKSGMVLLAAKSGKPLVPVYIKPRAHWYNRLTMVIGEPVQTDALFGKRPSFSQIEALTADLHKKEEELKKLCI